jgi:hypothetical protein
MADLTSILGGPWSPPKAIEPDPPERPVGLYRWCINYLPYSETILDPFFAGSCGVAIGIEREPRYFDIACAMQCPALISQGADPTAKGN